ncbi:MAG TPA: hypothetical protein VKQ52_07705, partial [Puia sp.]|nr:hypothetical protein [Puia sp.]
MNSHLKIFSRLFKQEGTARDDRYLPALHPENIAIDDRQLKDLLLYLQEYSGHLRFIPGSERMERDGDAADLIPGEESDNFNGQKDRPAQSWKEYLQMDIAVLLADIAAYPVEQTGRLFVELQKNFDMEPDGRSFNLLLDHTYAVFERLDRWYASAIKEQTDSKLKRDLRLYIQSYLSKKFADLRQIRLHAKSLLEGEEITLTKEHALLNVHKVWGEMNSGDRSYGEHVFSGKD